jgi:hypothetical protein
MNTLNDSKENLKVNPKVSSGLFDASKKKINKTTITPEVYPRQRNRKEIKSYNSSEGTFCTLNTESVINSLMENKSDANLQVSVDLQMQLIQSSNGVFIVQDIYGIESKADNAAIAKDETSTTSKDIASDEFSGDATECVICLTDPRCIAPLPCRHMCLCECCADALPSQDNKCPICRKQAYMLLK